MARANAPGSDQRDAHARYLDALLEPDPDGAREVVREAVDGGLEVSDAYAHVIGPALVEIGRL